MSFNFLKPPPETPYNFLSLGAGVQSSVLALMPLHGELPMPDAAIFADTMREPASVYTWLDWLEEQVPYPIYRVSDGDLGTESLRIYTSKEGKKYARNRLPCHTLDEKGNEGMVGRDCTRDFKLYPLFRKQKELAGIKRGQKEVTVTSWIGISRDEMTRVNPPRKDQRWVQNRWPLIEKDMHRHHCIQWMKDHGYPEPPRSACYFCPYHSNKEWRRLRDHEPEEFQKAVDFEKDLQAIAEKTGYMRSVPYLHRQRVPLDQADLNDDDPNQLWLWGEECEGMCGL